MNGLNENFVKMAMILASFVIAGALGLLVDPAWLMLLVVPLFGIPLLRELHVLKDADERETWDHYRGSHLAFYAIMIYVVVSSIISWVNGWPVRYELLTILYVAVIIKLLFGIAAVLDQRLAAILLMGLYGAIWLFVAIPAGYGLTEIAINSAGGLAVLLLAAVGWFFPLPSGVMLAMLSTLFLVYPVNVFTFQVPVEGTLSLVTIIVIPPLAAGWMLINSFIRQQRENGETSEAVS